MKTLTPHNNLLHLTGRLTSCERPPAPVAEEPRESLVLPRSEAYSLEEPFLSDPAGYETIRYAADTRGPTNAVSDILDPVRD